jgi:hypothetical protein
MVLNYLITWLLATTIATIACFCPTMEPSTGGWGVKPTTENRPSTTHLCRARPIFVTVFYLPAVGGNPVNLVNYFIWIYGLRAVG